MTKNNLQLSEDEIDNSKIFPQKLMEILSDPSNNKAITWLPHGKGFVILNRQKLSSDVLPKYFRKTKYPSFTRKLNRWNFTRVTRGSELGAYYHEFFQRGKESLCIQMYCKNDRAKFAVMSNKNQKNAYCSAMVKADQPLNMKECSLMLPKLTPSGLSPSSTSKMVASAVNIALPTKGLSMTNQNRIQQNHLATSLLQNYIIGSQMQSQPMIQQGLSPQEILLRMQMADLQIKQLQLEKQKMNLIRYKPPASSAA